MSIVIHKKNFGARENFFWKKKMFDVFIFWRFGLTEWAENIQIIDILGRGGTINHRIEVTSFFYVFFFDLWAELSELLTSLTFLVIKVNSKRIRYLNFVMKNPTFHSEMLQGNIIKSYSLFLWFDFFFLFFFPM